MRVATRIDAKSMKVAEATTEGRGESECAADRWQR